MHWPDVWATALTPGQWQLAINHSTRIAIYCRCQVYRPMGTSEQIIHAPKLLFAAVGIKFDQFVLAKKKKQLNLIQRKVSGWTNITCNESCYDLWLSFQFRRAYSPQSSPQTRQIKQPVFKIKKLFPRPLDRVPLRITIKSTAHMLTQSNIHLNST